MKVGAIERPRPHRISSDHGAAGSNVDRVEVDRFDWLAVQVNHLVDDERTVVLDRHVLHVGQHTCRRDKTDMITYM